MEISKEEFKALKKEQDGYKLKGSRWNSSEIKTLENLIQNGITHRKLINRYIKRTLGGIDHKLLSYRHDPKWKKYFEVAGEEDAD